jgi:hypothetical protein
MIRVRVVPVTWGTLLVHIALAVVQSALSADGMRSSLMTSQVSIEVREKLLDIIRELKSHPDDLERQILASCVDIAVEEIQTLIDNPPVQEPVVENNMPDKELKKSVLEAWDKVECEFNDDDGYEKSSYYDGYESTSRQHYLKTLKKIQSRSRAIHNFMYPKEYVSGYECDGIGVQGGQMR